ncbi:MAG: cytochrome c maturation protein CcmE [Gemmatimonadota bacterium]
MKTGHKFVIGSVVIGGGLVFLLFSGVKQSAARHMTLDMLLQPAATQVGGGRIQLGGCQVVAGSIQWDEYRHRPQFAVTDGQRVLPVRYTGNAVLPDTFKDQAQVVLEGRYDTGRGRFEADVVFAKCPSKYEGKSYDEHVEALAAPGAGS